jgi:hypothetical protein
MRTKQLTEMAYEWCSLACSNLSVTNEGTILSSCLLNLVFATLTPKGSEIEAKLTHREHHQKLATIIFRSEDGEAIADLLHAWTSESSSHTPYSSLKICAEHLIGLHNLQPFSPRLRHLTINAIKLIGYQPFEQAGIDGFIGLLNILDVSVEDAGYNYIWAKLLLDVIQSSGKIQDLSHSYWEQFVNLACYWAPELAESTTYNPHTMASLEGDGEWDKLECWLCVVWMMWSPEGGKTTEEDLEHVMFSLSSQRPGAIQEFKRKLEKNEEWRGASIPGSFQQICKKV